MKRNFKTIDTKSFKKNIKGKNKRIKGHLDTSIILRKVHKVDPIRINKNNGKKNKR